MKKLFLIFFLPTFLFGQDVTRTWDDTTLIVENVIVNGLISGVAELEFDTVAEMKAFDFSTVADGARVKCNGYNVANDGKFGPDVFWIAASTATDDGLSVFDPVASGAGRLIRSFNSKIMTSWAGSVGDGVADDTNAIQTALTLAGTIGIDLVYVEPGQYKLTNTITIPNNVNLAGTNLLKMNLKTTDLANPLGAHTVFNIQHTGGYGFVIGTVTGQTGNGMLNCIINYPDQVADTSSTPTVYPAAIYSGKGYVSLENIFIRRCYDGIKLDTNCGQYRIRDVNINPLNVGIYIDESKDSGTMENVFCSISDIVNGTNLATYQRANAVGFHFARSDDFRMLNCQAFNMLVGVKFTDLGIGSWGNIYGLLTDSCGTGILSNGLSGSGVRVVNSHFVNWDYDVRLSAGTNVWTFTGCVFSGATTTAINYILSDAAVTSLHIVINGNYFGANLGGAYAVYLSQLTANPGNLQATITGNMFRSGITNSLYYSAASGPLTYLGNNDYSVNADIPLGGNFRTVLPQGFIQTGTGSPLGVVAAQVGTLFLRTDGGATSTLYIKESGAGTAGWVAK